MAANPPILDTSSTDKSSNTSNILLAKEVTAAVAAAAATAAASPTTTGTSSTIATKPRPTCSCTNISIMQLFHEMKQEFPTVPDHVVSQCVLENCHDRLACIENLNKEALGHLGLQAYPSQTLHNNIKLTGLSRRLSGESKFNNNNNNYYYDKNINNNIISNSSTSNSVNVTSNYDNNNLNLNNNNPNLINNNNNNNINKFQKCVNNFNNIIKSDYKSSDMSQSKSDNNRKIPQRPTTLSLSSKPNPSGTFSRPTRVAPPPPPPVPIPIPSTLPQQISAGISSALTSALAVVPTASNVHHHYHQSPIVTPGAAVSSATAAATSVITTTATTTDSPANAESINVSLNVTVSPVSPRPPVRPPRHTTAISVQPEPAYIRDVPSSPRSYTSVNFTLRQPSQSPQSPIDISAGPSLTYTSSSFDARQGYQSRLQITMGGGGGGGSISAMRTRPRNIYNTGAIQNDNDDDDDMTSALVHPKSEAEIVHRQLVKKQCLLSELTNDKGRLETMQREIRALQAPLPVGGSTKLQEDIDQLQFQCKQMASEIEAAGNYVLGETNEAFYQNIYTGQKLPTQSRPPKPPRPPPPRPPAIQPLINNNFINNNNISNNRTDLNNSGNGGGDNNFNLTDNNNDNNNNVNNNNNGDGGQPWTCSMCTFSNHPLLDKCEQCEMPRISSGTVPIGPQINVQRLQDRHYQQSPPSPNNPSFNNYNDDNNNSSSIDSILPVETPVSATSTSTTPINKNNQFFNSANINDLASSQQQIEQKHINLNTSIPCITSNHINSNNTLLDTENSNLTNERILLLLPNVITDQSTIITTSSEGIHIHLSPGQRIIHSWVVS